MVRKAIVSIICGLSSMVLFAQGIDLERLNKAFTQKDWLAFVDCFPKSFTEFMEVYGYNTVTGAKPMYDVAYEHIKFLFSDNRILESENLDKLLQLTYGSYWDADAPSYLGLEINCSLIQHPAMFSKYLEDKPDMVVKDFLKCAIATPHPEPENSDYYEELMDTIRLYEKYSSKIAKLFRIAHEELMDEWCE